MAPAAVPSDPANAVDNSASISNGTRIDASLATSLDAKRSKAGDEVEVRTEEDVKQDGKVVLKKGARLVGHVTQEQARANGQSQSLLGIAFDHAVLKNGQEIPFPAPRSRLWHQRNLRRFGLHRCRRNDGFGWRDGRSARKGANWRRPCGWRSLQPPTQQRRSDGHGDEPRQFCPRSCAGGSLNTVARSSGAVGRADHDMWRAGFQQQRRIRPGGLSIDSACLERDAGILDRFGNEKCPFG